MDFSPTKEQEMLRKMAREFAKRRIEPTAKEDDRNEHLPLETIKGLASLGLLGARVPSEYGGTGMNHLAYITVVEEIARSSPSIALSVFGAHSLVEEMLMLWGNVEQKRKYLPSMCKGEALGCFGLSELGVGTEVTRVNTRAELKEGEWVLNGEKVFVINGGVARFSLIFAQANKDGESGVSAFLVERDMHGFLCENFERSGLCSANITTLCFQDCAIPQENLLAGIGDGVKIAQTLLDNLRFVVAAVCVGATQACLDASIEYAGQRQVFGRSISQFDMVQELITGMVIGNEAARLLTYQAADLKDKGLPFSKQLFIARAFASEVAIEATTKAIQVHGAYGYGREYPVERYFRDIAETILYGGTPSEEKLSAVRYVLGIIS